MRTFRFLAAARKELLDEIRYYGAAQECLGVRFEKAVAAAVRRAVANPEHGTARSQADAANAGEGLSLRHRLSGNRRDRAHSRRRGLQKTHRVLG